MSTAERQIDDLVVCSKIRPQETKFPPTLILSKWQLKERRLNCAMTYKDKIHHLTNILTHVQAIQEWWWSSRKIGTCSQYTPQVGESREVGPQRSTQPAIHSITGPNAQNIHFSKMRKTIYFIPIHVEADEIKNRNSSKNNKYSRTSRTSHGASLSNSSILLSSMKGSSLHWRGETDSKLCGEGSRKVDFPPSLYRSDNNPLQ